MTATISFEIKEYVVGAAIVPLVPACGRGCNAREDDWFEEGSLAKDSVATLRSGNGFTVFEYGGRVIRFIDPQAFQSPIYRRAWRYAKTLSQGMRRDLKRVGQNW